MTETRTDQGITPALKFPSPIACEECGEPFERRSGNQRFCSTRCRLKARDRRRYETDPEYERAKSRRYYARNRERVIARVKAYQARRREEYFSSRVGGVSASTAGEPSDTVPPSGGAA